MSVPDSPDKTHEPTVWCRVCDGPMLVHWIPNTPAWDFTCPTCPNSGQVLP